MITVAGERILVTGGTGCIGSWVVRGLLRQGVPVTVLAASGRLDRLRLVLADAELDAVSIVRGDVNDLPLVEAAARAANVTGIVHLAALQLPFCAADPIAGARVNVQGTATVFELARRLDLGHVVYASSAAVYAPASAYPDEVVAADAPLGPTSFYGVYKTANEQAAGVYHAAWGLSSTGIRPHSAYGPGRDQGVTSKPTVAMIAAAAGRPYHVDFGGAYQFQFTEDVAAAFVAAVLRRPEGAHVYSCPGPRVAVAEIVELLADLVPASRGRITAGDRVLPFPAAFDGAPIEQALGPLPRTTLAEGVERTVATYRAAFERGLLDDAWLDRVTAA
ncbi:MAG TPA: NAD(P)-dependent oxidoreductase [Candidatus Limnocylindrales bacterium]|nr:NAD(P)-dependent oxidoreductase [Candidatus Limnocylindrales bacterium]